ncbi:MAG TPA: DUF1385 domain-containing protein, partial [Polyangia bacterium]
AGAAGAAFAAARVRRAAAGAAIGEIGAALLSLAPALAALRGGELAAYHGAEHTAIAAYEHDDQDPANAAKEHDRCGSHLLAPLIVSNVAGAALLRRLSGSDQRWAAGAVGLASLGLSVELLSWSQRHPDSAAARLLHRPGHELQRAVGTREPDERQLDVGRAALREILRVEPAAAA